MKIKDIIYQLEKLIPVKGYEQYPKILVTGDIDQEVKKVAVCLNFMTNTIKEAKKRNCDLLLLHHGPPNYDPWELKSTQNKIKLAEKLGLAVYTLPLALDASDYGSNRGFAKIIGLEDESVTVSFEGKPLKNALSKLKQPITHQELVERLKKYNSAYIKIFGQKKKIYNRVIIAAGGGSKPDLIEQTQPEVYISGDMNIRTIRLAKEMGILLIELSHHSMENYPMKYLAEAIGKIIPVPVEFIEEPEFEVKLLKGQFDN